MTKALAYLLQESHGITELVRIKSHLAGAAAANSPRTLVRRDVLLALIQVAEEAAARETDPE